MTTLKELLDYGKKALTEGCIENGAHDAWLLMEHVCNIDRSFYYVHPEKTVTDGTAEEYRLLVEKRKRHIPLQQLTGEAWFMGLPFYVNENVFIPRQDTECLVEEVLKRGSKAERILDLCTGSGCILLSILHELRSVRGGSVRGVGADLSAPALEVAEKNRERLGIEAELVQSDLFEMIEGTFDMIVSNPPYIPSGVIDGLMEEVRAHEPAMALDGGEDGYDFYRKIIRRAPAYLRGGGWLCFEIGYDQGKGLEDLLKEEGFQEIQIIQDLAGLDRVAVGQWKS